MSERDHDNLVKNMQGVAATIREYAEQIESGEYLSAWNVFHVLDDGTEREVSSAGDIRATSEVDAIDRAFDLYNLGDGPEPLEATDLIARVDMPADEPWSDDTPISDYPLEVLDQRGREFAVVLSTGGPHIEVVADGLYNARLEGYWGGDHHTMGGEYLSTFLDYFIDRDAE